MPVFPNSVRRILPCVALSACLAVAWAAPPPASDPLREDVLGATMAGEFALQAGRLDEAAAWYLDAARAAGDGDPGLPSAPPGSPCWARTTAPPPRRWPCGARARPSRWPC